MPRLPVISGREAAKAFQRAGWALTRWRGSHMIFLKEDEEAALSIPDHRELDRGLLRSLIRDARMTVQEFTDLL
ncbi:MAG: type II toxin-antitoxin system HicA family toxin [Candidatus Omnitrophica bacterium]|nr:type II toxin-antitoxin system HicA family toxin [Candidatus Omnitrophota bacterium]